MRRVASMRFIDLSTSSRMARLMDLTRALRKSPTPYEALLKYCRYLGDAFHDRAQVILSTKGLRASEYRVWRLREDTGAEHFELTDPWTNMIAPVRCGGLLSEVIAEQEPHLIHEVDWTGDPHFAHVLAPYRAMIAVPLLSDQLPLNWSIMLTRDPARLNVADLEFSVNRAALVGSLIESLQVGSELVRAHAHIDAELKR